MLRVKNARGDTIVEVLISIAIAGLAIGTSSAIANRALQRAQSARERDQAIGLLEGQVTALKLRHNDPTTFNSVGSGFLYPTTNFCLDADSTGPSDASHPWGRQDNLSSITGSSPLKAPLAGPPTSPNAPYHSSCAPSTPSNGTFYINITTKQDPNSTTDYIFDVRWDRIGGGVNNATFYYRF